MESFIQLIIFLVLLSLGYFFGRRAEHKHYQSIFAREDEFRSIVITADKIPPPEYIRHNTSLVCGNVVISVDYFKTVTAALRNLVGGNIRAYETLLDRARREAILRMQQEAKLRNADAIINIKFQTSRISGNAGKGLGSIEVLAYGTALTSNQVH
jgi:uncharacterized protein YbjQ (UPF0145 family)